MAEVQEQGDNEGVEHTNSNEHGYRMIKISLIHQKLYLALIANSDPGALVGRLHFFKGFLL